MTRLGEFRKKRTCVERLDKTAGDIVWSQVRLGMTRLGKARKGGTWRRKTKQGIAKHGVEQSRVGHVQARQNPQGKSLAWED